MILDKRFLTLNREFMTLTTRYPVGFALPILIVSNLALPMAAIAQQQTVPLFFNGPSPTPASTPAPSPVRPPAVVPKPMAPIAPPQSLQNPEPSPTPAPAAVEVMIPDSTEIFLSTIDELSSKTARTGDLVDLRVDEDVIVEGKKVILAGTRARAEITDARKSGFAGKSGRLTLKILSTTAVDGSKVPLLSSRGSQGGGNLGASVAVAVLVSPLGLLIKGHSANIPAGTKVRAIVDGRTKVTLTPQ
jgi:hypothetical protein